MHLVLQEAWATRMNEPRSLTSGSFQIYSPPMFPAFLHSFVLPSFFKSEVNGRLKRVPPISSLESYWIYWMTRPGPSFKGQGIHLLGPFAVSSAASYPWAKHLHAASSIFSIRKPVDKLIHTQAGCWTTECWQGKQHLIINQPMAQFQ